MFSGVGFSMRICRLRTSLHRLSSPSMYVSPLLTMCLSADLHAEYGVWLLSCIVVFEGCVSSEACEVVAE